MPIVVIFLHNLKTQREFKVLLVFVFMIREILSLKWKKDFFHIPLEIDLSLRESIYYVSPSWEVFRQDDDTTVIRRPEWKTYISSGRDMTSGREMTTVLVDGDFGCAYDKLAGIREPIKKISRYSGIDVGGRTLSKETCSMKMVLEAYLTIEGNAENEINEDGIFLTLIPENGRTVFRTDDTYDSILRKYRTSFKNIEDTFTTL